MGFQMYGLFSIKQRFVITPQQSQHITEVATGFGIFLNQPHRLTGMTQLLTHYPQQMQGIHMARLLFENRLIAFGRLLKGTGFMQVKDLPYRLVLPCRGLAGHACCC